MRSRPGSRHSTGSMRQRSADQDLRASRILVLAPISLAPIILPSSCPVCRRSGGRSQAPWPWLAPRALSPDPARFITELLSKPIRYGYMNGIAIAVLISQLPKPSASR
jgi:hypothetical protein